VRNFEEWPLICFYPVVIVQIRTYGKAGLLRTWFLIGMLLVSLFTASRAQGVPSQDIDMALSSGDASGVSKYFGPSVDITINNSTSTYSRTQGEQVLRDFFSKNAVRDFDIEHSGNSGGSAATFTIGYLSTGNGRFRVYMWLKPGDNGYILKQIRFEK
jgi:hypothetical protein